MKLHPTIRKPQTAIRHSRSGFTLIEILVVITIIGILAALLFPAIGAAIKKGKIAQARADVKAIEAAIKQYMTEYGKLPVRDTLQGTVAPHTYFYTGAPNQQYQIMNTLRAIAIAGQDNANDVLNKKKIVFFEPPSRKAAVDTTNGYIYDPWGQPYGIQLDTDYNNSHDYYGTRTIPAVVVSYGPNKTQENPAASGTDDIVSFQ